MVTYLMASIILAILGAAAVAGFFMIAIPAYRRRRAIERENREISSEEALEKYLSQVDQATGADELDRLRNSIEKEDT
jgi:hypothetical protein